MKNILKFIGTVMVVVLAIDFFVLILWVLSGQAPDQDSFFIGKLSLEIINLIK